MDRPKVEWAEVTIDCRDTERVAAFWAELLGAPVRPHDVGWFQLGPMMPGGPVINIQPVPEAKVGKARVHLDLWVDDLAGRRRPSRGAGRPANGRGAHRARMHRHRDDRPGRHRVLSRRPAAGGVADNAPHRGLSREPLPSAARRCVTMAAAAPRIRPLGAPGDLGWVVMAHGEVYGDEFGWDGSFEALVARIVADFAVDHDPAREAGWIAELDGERVGCVVCVAKDDTTAQLRILLVHPDGRGLGLGARLVDECIGFAHEVGYERIVLWTNDPLVAARHVYLAAGFTLTDELPHHSFGHDLVGQTYELELARR